METGDEIKLSSHSSPRTMDEEQLQNAKALFSLVWHTEMSSIFGTGQSMNSMA